MSYRAGVSLPRTPPHQLAVDAAGIVQFAADDVQAAGIGDGGGELDVRAAAGHVRGDRHFARLAGELHNFRLGGDFVGVEHPVGDAGIGEQTRQVLRFVNGTGAH